MKIVLLLTTITTNDNKQQNKQQYWNSAKAHLQGSPKFSFFQVNFFTKIKHKLKPHAQTHKIKPCVTPD